MSKPFNFLFKKETTNDYFITGIRNNDKKVVTAIYDKYLKKVSYFVQRNGGNITEAKDIFQDALIIIFQKIEKDDLHLQKSFGSYLVGVCQKLWLKKLHQKKKEMDRGTVFELEKQNTIDFHIVFREQQKLYKEKFNLLSVDNQKILNLYFAKKKMSEIAKIMGYKSANYAQKKKHYAKKELIELIKADRRYTELRFLD